jgi:hypothetical protein
MPSRPLTIAIIVFWLGTTGFMLYREVLRWAWADEPPPITFELADEVGSQLISWKALQNGEEIGRGTSKVGRDRRRGADRAFELRSEFKFDKLTLFNVVEVKKLSSMYRVTPEGALRELETKLTVRPKGNPLLQLLPENIEIRGVVEEGLLKPRILFNGVEQEFFKLQPVAVSAHGNVLNPMHLLNRVPGLRAGQRWRIPLIDPFAPSLPGQSMAIPKLEAEVVTDSLLWNEQNVPCYRIDYNEPGKRVTASTWVRRQDGLVLRQEADYQAMSLVLEREPTKQE